MNGKPKVLSSVSRCPICGGAADLEEVARWPFACRRCVCKHIDRIVAIQAESILLWERTRPVERHGGPSKENRRAWSKAIEAGLKKLGIQTNHQQRGE